MNYVIEQPKRDQVYQILSLCVAHANFEKCEYNPEGKQKRLSKAIFSKEPRLHCRVAVVDGKYVGYITWMKQYSTWDATEYLYMDCLFLEDMYRSQGIGVALVNEMKNFGKKSAINLIQWQTPDFNTRAIKFYRKIGAISLSKERFFLEVTF